MGRPEKSTIFYIGKRGHRATVEVTVQALEKLGIAPGSEVRHGDPASDSRFEDRLDEVFHHDRQVLLNAAALNEPPAGHA